MAQKLPVLFLGHGSPMNAISDNAFTRAHAHLGRTLPRPRAILCVSAHWMTQGIGVTHMSHPPTIHDFGGFPDELFAVQYPAPGSPELAQEVRALYPEAQFDDSGWGLDHGAWSVLKHLYPQADVPVVQLSIDPSRDGTFHFELGRKIAPLRDRGVLILGSGNIVHNLRRIQWQDNAVQYPWAVEFDAWARDRLLAHDASALCTGYLTSEAGKLSVPTPDHYLPLLTVLGATSISDAVSFPTEGLQNGSISMRSVAWGLA